jgi:hypothetical protein
MPSPGVTSPGPFVTPPSPEPPVATRWLRTSAEVAEFEQGVLYGCGPAQVGFGDRLSSFHRLTLSSKGKLSPEPLRLTHPEGVAGAGMTSAPNPVGKGEAGVNGHSLPVVAVGSVPHIYRRAGLAPGDPN